ncbi:MAG TPA: SLBB domain-containing protein [Burkholderiales bacterium]|nr:SLBB domain-containing protein [Burkholderiales bacterium]
MCSTLRRLVHALNFALSMALLFSAGAHAQQIICGPGGVNIYGQVCDPAAAMTPPSGGGQQSGVFPPTTGPSGSPVITNRPPSGTAPSGRQPAIIDGSMRQLGAGREGPGFPRLERNEFQDLVLQSVGRDLPMFGYNLFYGVPTTFAPLDRVPVTPDYLIGPGDELLIRGWGAVDIDYRAIVDRDGTISIPRVGNLTVAGLRFQDLQPYLKNAVGRVYKNFELNVSLGQLRAMQVFIVGHAVRPGAYTVSSLTSLVNAVFASGGPTLKGSMRNIQLKRRDKVVVQFDMYDLLLRGDKSKDVQLLPGDVIHIPAIGPLAAVAGSVNTPAIYEIKAEKTLGELLQMASGLATTADGQKVSIERIVARRARQIEEVTLDSAGLGHTVRDGDLVTVLQLSPRFDNVVTVRGNVAVPARHAYRPGLRVRDVVPDRESLIVPDYWIKRNLIVRSDVTGRESFGLRPDMAYDLRYGAPTAEQRPLNPPRPRPARPEAWQTSGAQPGSGMDQQQANDLEAAQSRGPSETTTYQYERQQRLRSEVRPQLTEVNWDYAVVERLSREDLTTRLIPFNLARAVLDGDPQHNLALQPGDVITIFSKEEIPVPDAKQTKFVRLEGEVATPGVYQVLQGETLRQLVTRIGGTTPGAYLFGAELTRESVRVQQQKRLDESLDRLSQDVERAASTQAQRALDPADAPRLLAQAEGNRRLLERMRQVKATGRVVLDVPRDAQLKNLPEMALEDGDRLVVPPKPSTVFVLGAVYNQNAFIHDTNKNLSSYLDQAGGPTRDADSGRIYVLRADGSVTSRARGSYFSGDAEPMPGDTIVVPENLDKFQLTRELKDWSQIFYQFALGVAGLKVLRDF